MVMLEDGLIDFDILVEMNLSESILSKIRNQIDVSIITKEQIVFDELIFDRVLIISPSGLLFLNPDPETKEDNSP